MGFKHYTKSEIEKIVTMYGAGIGTLAIARELGRSEQYLRRFLSHIGVIRVKKQNECNDTLCWQCANAVPRTEHGRYVRGCSWSIAFEPVEGWTAQKVMMEVYCMKHKESYCVSACPKFVEG